MVIIVGLLFQSLKLHVPVLVPVPTLYLREGKAQVTLVITRFNTESVRRSFFSACNCIYARAKDLNELVHLSLQESYCLPILTYASAVVKYTVRQEDELNACWNSVYRKLFGFNKWESVKGFICGLGRLDLHHIIKDRKSVV